MANSVDPDLIILQSDLGLHNFILSEKHMYDNLTQLW